jgi:hypothetical protein
MKRGVVKCPVCGVYTDLRIWFGFFGRFSCANCGAVGFGHVQRMEDETENRPGVDDLYPPRKGDDNGHPKT